MKPKIWKYNGQWVCSYDCSTPMALVIEAKRYVKALNTPNISPLLEFDSMYG